MRKISALLLWSLLGALALTGCASLAHSQPSLGYACYRAFAYESQPRHYVCLFELSAPSTYYEDANVKRQLDSFVASAGGVCTVGPERHAADVAQIQMDHGLHYRLYDVTCK